MQFVVKKTYKDLKDKDYPQPKGKTGYEKFKKIKSILKQFYIGLGLPNDNYTFPATPLTKDFVENFNLLKWQEKLTKALELNTLQSELKQFSQKNSVPITLLIRCDEKNKIPLGITIISNEYGDGFDLRLFSYEVNRITKHNLTYVFDTMNVKKQIDRLTTKLNQSSDSKKRLDLISQFNTRWKGELCFEYSLIIQPSKHRKGFAEYKVKVTDSSGKTISHTSGYPVSLGNLEIELDNSKAKNIESNQSKTLSLLKCPEIKLNKSTEQSIEVKFVGSMDYKEEFVKPTIKEIDSSEDLLEEQNNNSPLFGKKKSKIDNRPQSSIGFFSKKNLYKTMAITASVAVTALAAYQISNR